MKNILLLAFIFLGVSSMSAQDTTWKKGGVVTLNFNQVSLVNWAAGGDGSYSITGLFNYFANHKSENTSWDNTLDLAYGLIKSSDNPIRKNEDRIELNSKYGKRATEEFFYTALFNFRSQFDNGYAYPNDSTIVSRFAAPAYVTFALGMDYKPLPYFSLFLSPATGKLTIVGDQRLADAGAYGVDKATFDPSGNKLTDGKTTRFEFGAFMVAKFQKEVMTNVSVTSNLTLFNNYTDKVSSNRTNIDVNWDLLISMKVNEYISATIATNVIYDHDIPVPIYETISGVKTKIGTGPRTQFKQSLGIGFGYKL